MIKRESLILGIFILLVISSLKVIASAYLLNQSLVLLMKTPTCDSGSDFCVEAELPPMKFGGNQNNLSQINSLLEKSIEINSRNGRSWSWRSVIAFALGEREGSFQAYHRALKLGSDSFIWLSGYSSSHIFKGYELAEKDNLHEAIREMRLGFALAGERIVVQDIVFFYHILSEYEKSSPLKKAKYLRRSGQLEESIELLTAFLTSELNLSERVEALTELGEAYWDSGQSELARRHWESSLELSPSSRACFAILAHDLGSAAMKSLCMNHTSPQYLLGRSGNDYQESISHELPSGAKLIGFDVDSHLLEIGPEVELILWWELPEKVKFPPNWGVKMGKWSLQYQRGINLAPNAGFEWDSEEKNLPLGYQREFYGADPKSIEIINSWRQDLETKVLLLDNTQNLNLKVGIEGPSHLIDPEANYLLAGWEWESVPTGNIGCLRGELGPYYVAYSTTDSPLEEWVYSADMVRLGVKNGKNLETEEELSTAQECSPFLLNYESQGKTLFDDILILRLQNLPIWD